MRPSRAPRPSSNCSQFADVVDAVVDVVVDAVVDAAVAVAVALLATFCVVVARLTAISC